MRLAREVMAKMREQTRGEHAWTVTLEIDTAPCNFATAVCNDCGTLACATDLGVLFLYPDPEPKRWSKERGLCRSSECVPACDPSFKRGSKRKP